MKKLTLYAVSHVETDTLPDGRVLIGVGKKDFPCDIRDDDGENIAEKNPTFCELTALYHIWKNSDSEYVGLEHYHRFFCKNNIFKSIPLSEAEILKKLEKHDALVSFKYYCFPNIYKRYKNAHIIEDLELCREVLTDKYPDYAATADVFFHSRRAHLFNMLVMKKSLLDEYCQWLFSILFELEKRINVENRDDYQRRVFGFLSERLLNIWLIKNNISTARAIVSAPARSR